MMFCNNRLLLRRMSGSRVRMVQTLSRVSMCLALCFFMTFTFAAQARAQSASFRSVDTNRDGVLSFEELVAAFGRAGAERLLRQTDRNNDSILTIRELRQQSDDDDRDTDRTPRDNDRGGSDDDDGDDDGDDDDDDDGDDGDGDDDGDDD